MAETLKLTNFSIDEVNNSSSNLLSLLENSDPKVQINIANSIWAKKGVEFNQNFIDVNKKYYQAKVTTLDFQQKDAADVINKWVSDSTEGKIPTIIEPPISYDTVMYLINAIYFKGTWTYEFDNKLTEDREFASSDGSKSQKAMMQQTRKDFSYLETNDFQAVELPYGEKKRLEMYVFLPKKDLTKLSEKLTSSNWSSWLSKFKEEEGTLLLPKFKIEYEVKLQDVLKKLGMGVAFEDSADFGKIAKGAFISEVLHKSYVDVNEEGTEAAAATSVDVTLGSIRPGQEKNVFYMEVNKPFFFAIADKETKEILFMGLVKNIP
jgi:serpin B